jgi:hypothetical protein
MSTPKNTLKGLFVTEAKPLKAQFWAWMDSFWHKDELIPKAKVDGLIDALNSIAGEVQLNFTANPSATWPATTECVLLAITVSCTVDATVSFGPAGAYGEVELLAGEKASVGISKTAYVDGDELLMTTTAGVATIKILKRNMI